MRTSHVVFTSVCLLFLGSSSSAGTSSPLQVDLGLDSGRSDTATQGWQEWQVPDGSSAEREFGVVQVSIRTAAHGTGIKGAWNKKGLATGATMATDGVTVEGRDQPAEMELEIRGLSPGRHSLVTYHNSFGNEVTGEYSVSIVGQESVVTVQPTFKVSDNVAAASAYLEFEAQADEPVVLRIARNRPEPDNVVILNGFEIDAVDPTRKAVRPIPADRDWHVNAEQGTLELTWEPAPSAVQHDVYLACDLEPGKVDALVATADHASRAYLGSAPATTWKVDVKTNDSLKHYRWRVDSVDQDGKVTRGDVWSFRVRHLAFPGAEGYGRFALGGRGGKVLHVTHLKDRGPGSLRAALEAQGPRTVVFDVSGRIVLERPLRIGDPYMTVAGHTAPAKGICISNYNLGILGAHDVVVRYLRVRPGDTSGKTLDGMGMASCDHAIIDHCSISWTQDESFSSRGAKNITLQRTLISEALNIAGHKKYRQGTAHGFAASIGGDVGSFHHNLLAHCAGRNWSLAGGLDQAGVHCGRLDIRNNVVYNWDYRTTDGGAMQVNFVNNYYKPGPATTVFHVLKPERNHAFGPQDYFVIGNVMEARYGADQRYAGVRAPRSEPMERFLVDQPFFESYVTTQSAKDAYEDVLADVGCNVPMLDEHDRRIIRETRAGTAIYKGSVSGKPGLPDSQEDVGGWEDYPEVQRAADWDTDGDGMPTAWERDRRLNPDDASDGTTDPDGDGYTNLEDYLNWLAAGNTLEPR